MTTKIEWAQEVWNPVTGCRDEIVSSGCINCYARRMANRLKGRYGYPKENPFAITVHMDRMNDPAKWQKPRRVLVCSMGDLFHNDVPLNVQGDIIEKIKKFPQHNFLLLTKRIDSMFQFFDACCHVPDNCWPGVTVCNQQEADEKIPILRSIPAAVRFISVEPMLEQIDLCLSPGFEISAPYGNRGIHLVICGGESGPGARPMKVEWAISVKNQCQAASVPFFFKSHGTHYQLGKLTNRLLEGREWNELPEVK